MALTVWLLVLATLIPNSFAAEDLLWWQTGVIYQIYPRSFKDSNNDGIGDLPGITQGLPYLADTGIAAIWLSPMYPSPMVDFGYDISNYTDVNPEYGTLEDFDELVRVAKSLGLRVILDFVPNHSSDLHPWFLKSLAREPGYEDYYIWRDPKGIDEDGNPIPPNNWLSRFYGSGWQYRKERGQFYLHQFATGQPDLNYRSPRLVQEMKDVLSFWMKRGVDGFRIDAINTLFESTIEDDEPISLNGCEDPNDFCHLDHIYTQDQPETYGMVRQWRILLDAQSAADNSSRCIMVEMYGSYPLTMAYFGTAEEPIAHFPFNFYFIPINNETTAKEYKRIIDEWIDNVPSWGWHNWLVGNHDQHRVGSRVGEELVDAVNILVQTLPGTAVTYYGEEIGMMNNYDITYDDGKDPNGCNYPEDQWYQRSRDFERTPFQWNNSKNAGFNEGAETWLPVHSNYKTVNVATEKAIDDSHYNVYKNLLKLRKEELYKTGAVTVQLIGENALCILRHLDASTMGASLINFGSESLVVNLTKYFPISASLDMVVQVAGASSSYNRGDNAWPGNIILDGYTGIVVTAGVPKN